MAHAAEDLDISAIAVFTETGTTARQLSKYRPKPQIFALSSVDVVINRMTLLWGVFPIKCTKANTTEAMVDLAERVLEEGHYVRPREILGIVAGTRTRSGSTNFLRLHVLGDRPLELPRPQEIAPPISSRVKTTKHAKPKARPVKRPRSRA
jgi:pyruvate kinase